MLSTKTTFFQSFDVDSQQLNHFCLFSFRKGKRGTEGVGNPHLFFLCYLCLFLLYYCYCIFAYASYFMIWNGESTNPNSDKCSDNRVKSGVMWDVRLVKYWLSFELNVSGFGFWRFGLKFLKIKMISPCPGSSFSHRLASQPWTLDSMCFFFLRKSLYRWWIIICNHDQCKV